MLNLGCVLRAEGDPDGARSLFEASLWINRRNGDNWAMASGISSLACLAGDAGDWDRAAALHGAAQALLDRTGVAWDEGDARDRQHSLGQARARLGDQQLERPTPKARRSAWRKPSSWPSRKRAQPDHGRHLTSGQS